MNEKEYILQVAVLMEEMAIQPWQQSIFDAVNNRERFNVLIVKKPVLENAPAANSVQWLRRTIDKFEQKLSRRLFAVVFGSKRGARDNAVGFDTQNSAESAWENSIKADGAQSQLDGVKLDIILDLRRHPDTTSVDHDARFGRWYLVIGEGEATRDATKFAGFNEVNASKPNVHVELRVQPDAGQGSFPIERGCFRTFLWSWNENERQLRYKSAAMMADMLGEVARKLAADPNYEITSSDISGDAAGDASEMTRQLDPPAPHVMIFALVKCMWRILSESVTRVFFHEKWSLHIAKGSAIDADLSAAQAIEPPSNSYWADPFFIKREGRKYIFFEEYLYAKKKGVISVAEVSNTGGKWVAGEAQIIIERDYHMSYPFMFDMDGELYMIPESNADNCIGLWKCKNFPHNWQKISNLMDNVSATDTTLHNHNGRWWMFTNLDRIGLGDHCSELHIFSTNDPLNGQWDAHPANPVVRDARCARMAGPLVMTEEHGLIRPAQINERYYGHALALYQITELNEQNYSEKLVRRIDPDWRPGIYRNHHVSGEGDYVVVDACRDQFKLEKKFNPSATAISKLAKTDETHTQTGGRADIKMRVHHG